MEENKSEAFSRLWKRCITAVKEMAVGMGKNRAKKGINTVPRPNPE